MPPTKTFKQNVLLGNELLMSLSALALKRSRSLNWKKRSQEKDRLRPKTKQWTNLNRRRKFLQEMLDIVFIKLNEWRFSHVVVCSSRRHFNCSFLFAIWGIYSFDPESSQYNATAAMLKVLVMPQWE